MSYWLELNLKDHEFVFTDGKVGIDAETGSLDEPDFVEALRFALALNKPISLFYGYISTYTYNYSTKSNNWTRAPIDAAEQLISAIAELSAIPDAYESLPEEMREACRQLRPIIEEEQAAREFKARQAAAKAEKRRGYVYILRSPTGTFKIGRTVNPSNRLKTFEVKLPFEVEYECLLKCEDMVRTEKDLHDRFAHKRVNGEWFTLSADDVAYIKSLESPS